MRTKKKNLARNAARERELASPSGKVLGNVQIAQAKAADLITSSARKTRFGISPNMSKDMVSTKDLNSTCLMDCDENEGNYREADAMNGFSIDHKGCAEASAPCVFGTLFSPAFHISKNVGGMSNGVDCGKLSKCGDRKVYEENGIGHTQCDKPNGYVSLDTFASLRREEQKNLYGNIGSEMATTCPTMLSNHSNLWNSNTQLSPLETNFLTAHWNDDLNGANVLSEVSAIYLAMQQSKLGYHDEADQLSLSNEALVDADDVEDIDDFDPFFFIKSLPELSSVVPTFRPVLLPKQTRSCPPTTLVLDLDETLVHSSLLPIDDADFTFTVNLDLKDHMVYVRCRPHLKDFMEKIANLFEIIIFTASQSIYAEQLLNVLDPKRRVFRHRIYRESCVYVDGNYLKDLSVLGRDLAHVVIVDNSPQAFGFQLDNGVPIESWFDDPSDQELLQLFPFLESLIGADDVRPLIAKKYNLRERVAAAVHPSIDNLRGELFAR
ncbi:hypothetical protein Scep_020995 [Stephania cephalantha]|uniref:FCP1 homology domain-containing protein n=1 Tax=Stephania cephalantha TaxID=152367 RepID=A0AAP0F2K2_9MAGN